MTMNFRKHTRILALASMLALMIVGIPAVQGAGATGITAPPGPIAPPSCTLVWGITAPPGPIAPGQPNLQVQILGTHITCNRVDPTDPDVCAEPTINVNIQVSNLGAASPATKLAWQFAPSDVCCPAPRGVRPVPSLAPGQAENDSWQIYPWIGAPGLPPGTCQLLAIRVNPNGGQVSLGGPISAETTVCNTIG